MEIITFNNKEYPAFQAKGNAAKFCRPFAEEFCKGFGYDVGCMKKEWSFPGSVPIDISFDDGYHALNLPEKSADYIHSSHCLEHIPDWVGVLDYWISKLNPGGVIFLYLPDYSQEYWRPWNNRKHVNILSPEILRDYFIDREAKHLFISGVDLYNSFYASAIF